MQPGAIDGFRLEADLCHQIARNHRREGDDILEDLVTVLVEAWRIVGIDRAFGDIDEAVIRTQMIGEFVPGVGAQHLPAARRAVIGLDQNGAGRIAEDEMHVAA